MDELPETTEFLTFVRTVEARSISRAARELGVPRPTVGRRLARLEEKLGVRLLRRTTRTMVLTDAGEALYQRARGVIAAVREAEQSVRRSDDAVRGTLRVSAPPMNLLHFGAMISDFIGRYPDVRLELDLTTRHVDLAAGSYDVAIRAAAQLPPGLIARNLMRSRLVAVASPEYLARHGTPRRVTEIAKHACLVGFAQGEHPSTHWPLVRGGQVRVEALMATNDLGVLLTAALGGRGVALLPLPLVYDDVAAGKLVAVLPERLGGETQLAVVYPEREFVAPAVRAFVDAVVTWAKGAPELTRKMPACDEHAKKAGAKTRR
ncbi:MAG: LysR family transcriptional regulator [Deltaproteobacteria bacterium]|nr:LysR family transcriptional regulator [Deltaproteobacteria bacterium]MBP6832291.1 LysR family transcriptional regulator [Deltaproteobacteria bacterium]